MRRTDLEPREAVERALEDQMRQRDRGFERVADRVGQKPAAVEPAAGCELTAAGRVHEDQDAELFGLGPDRVEFRIGQLLPRDAAADRQPVQLQFLIACSHCSTASWGCGFDGLSKRARRIARNITQHRVDVTQLRINDGAIYLQPAITWVNG